VTGGAAGEVAVAMNSGEAAVRLGHLRRFAHLMDDGIKVPGIPLRVGLDPIIGLVPGIGDAAGAILGAWILVEAARLRASHATLVRIFYNIAVDALGGTIPLLGDAFDVVWKANLRNVALLERHLADPARAGKADRRFVALLCGAVLVLCLALAAAGALLVATLIHFVAGH
jgi:hypothetical protein